MVNGKSVTVVIPCRNEEKIIAQTIKEIPEYVDEIIVVDNGSVDKTVQVARDAGARVLTDERTKNGIGYGYALMKGMHFSTSDIVVTMDGDNTYPSYQIRGIIDYLDYNNLDVISCNRLPLRKKEAISTVRRLGIYVLNLAVTVLYGYKIKDILTGMFALRSEVIPKLNLRMGDWNLSPEVKISAIVNPKISFDEFHIDHFERDKEPSKQAIWKTGINHLMYIIKRRFSDDRGFSRVFKNK